MNGKENESSNSDYENGCWRGKEKPKKRRLEIVDTRAASVCVGDVKDRDKRKSRTRVADSKYWGGEGEKKEDDAS